MNYEQQCLAVFEAYESREMTVREFAASLAFLNMQHWKRVAFNASPYTPQATPQTSRGYSLPGHWAQG